MWTLPEALIELKRSSEWSWLNRWVQTHRWTWSSSGIISIKVSVLMTNLMTDKYLKKTKGFISLIMLKQDTERKHLGILFTESGKFILPLYPTEVKQQRVTGMATVIDLLLLWYPLWINCTANLLGTKLLCASYRAANLIFFWDVEPTSNNIRTGKAWKKNMQYLHLHDVNTVS